MGKLRANLQAKILLLVLLLLGVGFGSTTIISIETERQLLMDQIEDRASILASTIHKSIRNSMLEGRPDIARSLLNELKRQKGVKSLKVYRVDGTEAFIDMKTLDKIKDFGIPLLEESVVKSIEDKAKRSKDQMESLKDDPHFQKAVATGKNIRWMHDIHEKDGTSVRALTFLKPLENEDDCQLCHGAQSKIRGIVRVSTDIGELDSKTADLRNRQILIALGTLAAVAFSLIFFLRRTIVRPIEDLAACAVRIGQGDFDACPPAQEGGDEIGRLGQSFRKMASSLSTAYADIQNKNVELEKTLEDLRESRKKVEVLEAVKEQLTKFVPESVKRLLEENPDADTLEKKDKDVTVVFLDLEGYTKMSSMFPQDIVNNVLEAYFSAFLAIVSEHRGDINETAGDGLMIIFQDDEDPLAHAANAIEAAIKIRLRALEINTEQSEEYPAVKPNIGINTGTASVGATKFEAPGGAARWTFTASGPVTNHAARIGAKATQGRIFIGPETARRVVDNYSLVDMGKHELKNVAEPMQIYQVIPTGTIYPLGTMDPVEAFEKATEKN